MKPLVALAAALAATFSLSAQALGRLADISIFDRSTGRELPVHCHEGKPYVVGRPGNEYQVVVRNRTREDLLAVVSVDGVNVVSGQTASPHQGGYVLAPRDTTRIAGWRKTLGETAAFYFTSLGDSYAGRTGRPDNVGVIGVAVFQRKHTPPPMLEEPGEPWGHSRRERHSQDSAAAPSAAPGHEAQAESRLKSAPLGTGHGRREASPVREVAFERRTREPVEIIAIRYDSYRNLVAQGVLHQAPPLRDPNPFPTRFVPDP
jgi:hypothetical protein